jgi:rod shape-determining protein MreD
MKKFLIILALIVQGLIIYFLQVNVFSNLTIAGIKPNLLVIYVLCLGLYANSYVGVGLGAFFGLLLDLLFGKVIGISAIMLCIVGFLGSYFDKNFSKENKITIILMSMGATIIYELGTYFVSSIMLGFDAEYWLFFKKIIVEVIYNSLLVIIFYPLIQKIGYWIDRNFKKTNILTRYF